MESDAEDMNVEIDDDDIRENIEESRRPIEPEAEDFMQIDRLESKIQQMEGVNYFQEDESDEDVKMNSTKEKPWQRYYGAYYPILILNDEPVFAVSTKITVNIVLLILIGFGDYVQVSADQSSVQFILSLSICVLESIGYFCCSILNPGIYTAQFQIGISNVSCDICSVVHYNHDSYHCEYCDVCIREFHHHSQFFQKCIGQGNIFYYYLSIVMMPMYIINLIAVIIL